MPHLLLHLVMSGVLAGLTVVAQERPRQQIGVPYPTLPPIHLTASCTSQFAIQFTHVDDIARVYLDDTLLFESFHANSGIRPGPLRGIGHKRGNSGGLVDLSPHVKEGMHTLAVELFNKAVCCTAALRTEFFQDNAVQHDYFFYRKHGPSGVVYRQEFQIDKAPCGTHTPPSTLGNS
jgi:hypothetical protein